MIKRIIEFLRHGVWQTPEREGGLFRWILRPFRIILFTIRGIGEHDLAVRSAALTFYTVMSLVPIAALMFGVMKGFGFDMRLWEYLYGQFPDYTLVIDQVQVFIENLLDRTRGGVIAAVGFFVLLWAVMKVFGNVEKALNNIWEVKKSRSLARQISDYVTVVIISPILIISIASIGIHVRNSLGTSWLLEAVYALVALAMLWLLFAVMFSVMPNTKVKFKGALIAGIISGTIFALFTYLYFTIQVRVSAFNAIYGTLAAIPLFLAWLQIGWQIMLVGAELSLAYQNIERYEQERDAIHMNHDRKRKVLLATMVTVIRHFRNNSDPVHSEEVASELGLPVRIVRDVIHDLEDAGLVVAVKSKEDERVNLYIPARDVNTLKVYDVIDAVEHYGTSHLDVESLPRMKKVSKLLDDIKHIALDSQYNVPLIELIEKEKRS